MNSFLPNQQGYHSPLSQAPWIFLSDFHIVSASREERKLWNSEYLLEYFLLNKEEGGERKKKESTADLISHLGYALTKEKLLNSATTSCPKPGINAPPKTCTCPNPPPSPNLSHFISQLDNTVGKSRQHETYINKNNNNKKKKK